MENEEKAKDFIEKFHNLEGVLLKERKKSLFLLFQDSISLKNNHQVLEKINELLKPKTYLEEIYKLEFLIYFRRASNLLDILKNENDLIASKIIRQPWFLKESFNIIQPKEFVRNIFPQFSVAIRTKILKQILKRFKGNEEFMESLFDEIFETYGLEPALIIISGCSVNKIKEILVSRKLNLSKAQLKLLHDKDSSLISFYYEQFYRRGGNMMVLGDFLVYLSKKEVNLYVKLLQKYKIYGNYRLGRRTTRKYISENKESILKEPQNYIDFIQFQKQSFFKELGDEFPIFFRAIFPKQLSKLKDSKVKSFLNWYPKNKRYELYFNTFQYVYGQSLFETKSFMFEDLLAIIPNVEEREKWVEKYENEVKYIKYKRSSVAIAELKEQLVRCDDIKFRQELLLYLVQACSINKDYDSLLNVLKLFCSRFRNTDDFVVYSFLNSIYSNIKLEGLKEAHWKHIHEIIMIQNIRHSNIHAGILFEYIRYLYKSGKAFEEMLPILLKSNDFDLKGLRIKDEREFSKLFLNLVLKYQSGVKALREDTPKTTEIVLAVIQWNKNYTNDTIVVCEQKAILDTIKKALTTDDWYYREKAINILNYMVCHENIPEDFLDIYFNHLDQLRSTTINRWFLKYNPNVFTENIDKIIECMFMFTGYDLMKFLKKYEHNGLVQNIVRLCLQKLKNSEGDDYHEIANLLAFLMPRTEFLKLLDEYVPSIDKLNITESTEEEKNILKIQIALANSVRFSSYNMDALPILLKYCKGDCLQPALHSLYKCFSKTPENNLRPLMNVLLNKSVSFRKHTIFLAAMAFPIKINEDLCNKMISDKNESIQKHLFTSSYKYFLKNPLESFWNILKNYMSCLTVYEKESLLRLTNVYVIPQSYKDVFMKEAFKVFTRLEKGNFMNEYYDKLMKSVADDDIKFLSSDLCMNIIHAKFFREEYKENAACMDFAIKFMMYGDDMRSNIRSVLNILEDHKRKYWNSKEISVYVKSVIQSFCNKIMYKSMETTKLRIPLRKEFVSFLSEEWKNSFTLQETFEEYLMLDFMVLKYKDTEDLTFYAIELSKSFQGLRNVLGDFIVPLVNGFLSRNMRCLLGDENFHWKLLELLSNILKYDSSLFTCLLVVQLLPSHRDDEMNTNFEYVMEVLRDKDEIVQMYLNAYLKNQNCC